MDNFVVVVAVVGCTVPYLFVQTYITFEKPMFYLDLLVQSTRKHIYTYLVHQTWQTIILQMKEIDEDEEEAEEEKKKKPEKKKGQNLKKNDTSLSMKFSVHFSL